MKFLGIHLVEHYFDIETTGLNPEHDKVITVQIQKMDGWTGELIGEIEIQKEWESSERELLEKAIPLLTCENPFDFLMIGKNLLFDFMFLSKRAEKYGLRSMDLHCLHNRAFLDLKHVLVMINEGGFRGYDKLLKKGKHVNEQIPELYMQRKYDEIAEYIKEEAKTFIEAYRKLKKEMPLLARHL
jgi:DNA polymerase elongation subunit (family B)